MDTINKLIADMNPDITLIVGMVLTLLAILSFLSAYSENRAPRVAALTALVAGALILHAFNLNEGGYRLQDIPDVVYGAIGDFIG